MLMQIHNASDDIKIKLLNASYINTQIGLKHFNNNKNLYIKILNSFNQRYENLNLYDLKEEELERTLHTMRGLSATLGMEILATHLEELAEKLEEKKINIFNQQLRDIVNNINLII